MESGRVALVTGSKSGLGREMVWRLAGAGARVLVTGRDEVRGEEVVGEITAGGEAVFVAYDLEGDDPTRLVEEAEGAFGRGVDILVNNGGGAHVRVHGSGWRRPSRPGASGCPRRSRRR